MTPERIKQIMAKLGKTKDEFAKLIGASPRTVDGWLSKRPPSKMTGRLIEAMLRK